jgi:hypothetical protein
VERIAIKRAVPTPILTRRVLHLQWKPVAKLGTDPDAFGRSSEAHHFLEIAERAVLAGSKRFHLRAMAAEVAN